MFLTQIDCTIICWRQKVWPGYRWEAIVKITKKNFFHILLRRPDSTFQGFQTYRGLEFFFKMFASLSSTICKKPQPIWLIRSKVIDHRLITAHPPKSRKSIFRYRRRRKFFREKRISYLDSTSQITPGYQLSAKSKKFCELCPVLFGPYKKPLLKSTIYSHFCVEKTTTVFDKDTVTIR